MQRGSTEKNIGGRSVKKHIVAAHHWQFLYSSVSLSISVRQLCSFWRLQPTCGSHASKHSTHVLTPPYLGALGGRRQYIYGRGYFQLLSLVHCKHFGFIKVNRSLSKLIKTLNLASIPKIDHVTRLC